MLYDSVNDINLRLTAWEARDSTEETLDLGLPREVTIRRARKGLRVDSKYTNSLGHRDLRGWCEVERKGHRAQVVQH